ncbi:hypothetical protein SAOR_00705 [Salinisphaera orenii MK-B5]|uniref:Anti sigma-E protein RseA N-terminal domain-containing protein n=1 Tax=Salinisphaera orenii MK-B5 TaxID=856730 RepID=A0A423PYH7_9GAMM|nr:sigma-E factor negative regulatory protein [Salinisphaera orenii]ROO30580.1 hypothetical protein SAOR_00705 [Salinisphaera orenii MK-B5]
MNERFSAFLDNEATRDEADSVVNRLLSDPELRDSWSRQHWLRTTLRAHRGEIAVPLDTGFSDRVMQAIAAEDGEAVEAPSSRVVSLPRARTPRRRRWRNMAGLAVAASAAGFVFLVNPPLQQESESDGSTRPMSATSVASADATAAGARFETTEEVAARGGMDAAVVGDASARQTVREGPADHWSVSDPALEDELNSYLVEHNGLARGYGLSGTTPAFVRVATYGQESTQ